MEAFFLVFLTLLGMTHVSDAAVTVQERSTFFVPYTYFRGHPEYFLNKGAVEAIAYDPEAEIAYVAGAHYIHILDLSNVTEPEVLFKKEMEGSVSSMAFCEKWIVMTVLGESDIQRGKVSIYQTFSPGDENWDAYYEMEVGFGPDSVAFTGSCDTFLVSNEGEADETDDGAAFVNPEGSITFGTIDEANEEISLRTLDFTSFNARSEEYALAGVRWPYKGSLFRGTGSFSQNIEPGSITFNSDFSRAFVSLQENNAIAVVDVKNESIESITSLDTKAWNKIQLDPSDMDGGINFDNYGIESFRQPDGIRFITIGNEGYIVTANEGAMFDYVFVEDTWQEFKRGKEIVEQDLLSDQSSDTLRQALMDDEKLGRLLFSVVDELDGDGKVIRPRFYGARGFSIFRASDLELVYDSGDEIAREIAERFPEVFNGDSVPSDPSVDTPASLMDKLSPSTGSECESLEIGEIDGKQYLFIGIDGASVIAIYSFSDDSPVPTFETMFRPGGTNETFTELFNDKLIGDLAPENLVFVPGSGVTPARLLIGGKVSGALSIYDISGGLPVGVLKPVNWFMVLSVMVFGMVATRSQLY